ncbi:MAG: amidase domain-containing protein [Oscillospiraceae bacterium]|jgi:hypothetical protein|nr:amidase domain-containing protein [Oscillospiraceae bacterium]
MLYNRAAAVRYAHIWAHRRNPKYYDYTNLGGDCTNFASQCIFAGLGAMDYGRNGWYYRNANDKSPSWTGVPFLYEYLTRTGKAAPCNPETLAAGDLVQLSFDGAAYSHSLIVVEVAPAILVATHTYDADYRPLTSYTFGKARGLHFN